MLDAADRETASADSQLAFNVSVVPVPPIEDAEQLVSKSKVCRMRGKIRKSRKRWRES